MDQVKEFLRQCVKYRFWIAAGFSVLLPMIGYFVGAGPIQAKAKAETDKIVAADKDVVKYTSPGIPNDQYKPIVDDKKGVLTTDVNHAHEKLYARQAPLLKWPGLVEEKFKAWGRKMPDDVDKSVVQRTITDYVIEYPKVVEETYKKVNPWNTVEGTGIVVVPEKDAFLRPSVFAVDTPPGLTKVWSAQERLWVQGALLDAVARINGTAKNWDQAVVKQINVMEVGSPIAQDQFSLAKATAVEAAPPIEGDAEAVPADPAGGGGGGMPNAPGGQGGYPGPGGRGGSGGAAAATEDVYYVHTDSTQFKIVPIMLTVLVDQNRLQEFLVGLENAPMTIQVLEFEMYKPLAPVTKPVKGEANSFGGMGMFGSGMGRGGMGGRFGEGGMMPSGGQGGYPSGGMPPGAMGGRGGMGMQGYGPGGGGGAPASKGKDNRSQDPKKEREEKEKRLREKTRNVDMYYDIVEVTVYGQARFYNPPPPPPEADSTSTPAPADPAKPADELVKKADKPADEPAKKDDAKPADAPAKDEPAKPADGSAKKDEPAKKDGAAKGDEPKKGEAKPADAPKGTDVPKA